MKTIQRLAFVVVATIVCLSASAIDIKLKKDKTVVDGITFAINAKKQVAQVVRGEQPYVGDIVIPEKITVDSVVCYVEEIASNGFKDCPGVTSIVIPNCITKIGSSAFQGCSSIAEITIPSRIQELPTSLFENCTSLTTVNFEGSVKKLGNNIFEGCKSLVDFEVPSAVTEIPSDAFRGCSALTSLTLNCTRLAAASSTSANVYGSDANASVFYNCGSRAGLHRKNLKK